MGYDYRQAVLDDVTEYINGHLDEFKGMDRDTLEDKLNEDLWTNDGVTGNGSGSYTFSTWQAEENLSHNWDIMEEMAEEFGIDEVKISTGYDHGAEWWDVSIRCYLLGESIAKALDELEESGFFEEQEDER